MACQPDEVIKLIQQMRRGCPKAVMITTRLSHHPLPFLLLLRRVRSESRKPPILRLMRRLSEKFPLCPGSLQPVASGLRARNSTIGKLSSQHRRRNCQQSEHCPLIAAAGCVKPGAALEWGCQHTSGWAAKADGAQPVNVTGRQCAAGPDIP